MFTSKLLLYKPHIISPMLIFSFTFFLLLCPNQNPCFFFCSPSTAAATFRQAVALIFDQVVSAESLPMPKFGSSSQTARTGSVTGDLSQNINNSEYVSPDRFSLSYSLILIFVLSLLGR